MRWSATAKALHWSTAALVIGLLGLGFWMTRAPMPMAARFDFYQLHKSLGLVALGLALGRLAHLARRRAPALPGGALERRLALVGRAGLWTLLFAAPLTGWAAASASPLAIPTLVFGLVQAPDLIAPDVAVYAIASALHLGFAILFAVLICGHAAAALRHHVLDRDDTLVGMLPGSALPRHRKR